MAKVHTRAKRLHAMGKGTKVLGAKTFKTAELAAAYAKEHDLSGAIVPAKKGKKFKIEK